MPEFVEPRIRHSYGAGTSGTVSEKHDQAFMVGIEVSSTLRVPESVASFGVHGHLSIRNFGVIGDFYSGLSDVEATNGDKAYGYAFGWLAGTGFLAVGPELVISPRRFVKPWLSLGTSLFLAIDPREETDEVIAGHAARVAVGYDFAVDAGISVRVNYAPADGAGVIGTTGPSVMMVMATIDVRSFKKRR